MRGDMFVDLEALIAIVDHGSFGKAAQQLQVSPSALSQTIRAFEDAMGVRLLNRTTRSVAPTSAGARLIARAAPALAMVRDALTTDTEPVGRLRINMPPLVARHILKAAMFDFLATYRNITLDIVVDDGISAKGADECDAGIRLGHLVEKDMTSIRITDDLNIVLVASSAYLSRSGRIVSPQDLRHHQCLALRSLSDGAVYPWRFSHGPDRVELMPQGPIVTTDLILLINAAVEGLGIAYLFEEAVKDRLASGALVHVLPEWRAAMPGFHLYHAYAGQVPGALAMFIDHLRAGLGRDVACPDGRGR